MKFNKKYDELVEARTLGATTLTAITTDLFEKTKPLILNDQEINLSKSWFDVKILINYIGLKLCELEDKTDFFDRSDVPLSLSKLNLIELNSYISQLKNLKTNDPGNFDAQSEILRHITDMNAVILSKASLKKYMEQIRTMSQFVPGLLSTQVDSTMDVNILPMFSEYLKQNQTIFKKITNRENKERESIEDLRITFIDLVELFNKSPLSKNENGFNTFGKMNTKTYNLLTKLVNEINEKKMQEQQSETDNNENFILLENEIKEKEVEKQQNQSNEFALVQQYANIEESNIKNGEDEVLQMIALGIMPCKTTYALNDTIAVISNSLPEFSSRFSEIRKSVSGLFKTLRCQVTAIFSRPTASASASSASASSASAAYTEEAPQLVVVSFSEYIRAREEAKKRIKQGMQDKKNWGGKKTKKRQRTRKVKSKGKKYKSKKRK